MYAAAGQDITSSSNANTIQTTLDTAVEDTGGTTSVQSSGIGRNLRNQISRLFRSSHSIESANKSKRVHGKDKKSKEAYPSLTSASQVSSSRRFSKRLLPQRSLQVYAAKKVEAAPPPSAAEQAATADPADDGQKDDEESLGSFMKGPNYRHLDPKYVNKTRSKLFY